jgi:hypothetical protein
MILIVLRNFRRQPTDETPSQGENQGTTSGLRDCKDSLPTGRKLPAGVAIRRAPDG